MLGSRYVIPALALFLAGGTLLTFQNCIEEGVTINPPGPSDNPTPTISGTTSAPNQEVYVYFDSECLNEIPDHTTMSGPDSRFSAQVSVPLKTTTQIYVSDAANPTYCVSAGSYTHATPDVLTGDHNSAFVAGSPPAPAPTYTVTAGSGGNLGAFDDIRLRIPYEIYMNWDTGLTTVEVGGAASSKVSSALEFEDHHKTAVIDITTDLQENDVVSLSGLVFSSFHGPPSQPTNIRLINAAGDTLAVDDKTVVIGRPSITSGRNQTFRTGDPPTPIATITISEDNSMQTIVGDLRVEIPSYLNMTWDPAVTMATVGGSASSKVSTEVSYENLDSTLVIHVSAAFLPGDDLTISDLRFKDFVASYWWGTLRLIADPLGGPTDHDNYTIQVLTP